MAYVASSSSNSTIKKEGNEDCQQKNNEIRIWVESIERGLRGVCPWQSKYSIFRVPKRLRKLKPEIYTPQSFSIGPLHYDEEHLQPMQVHKLRFLNHFLNRHKGKTLDFFVKKMSELEEKARKCYLETTGRGFQKDEFVKMMVIDSCFILEFFENIEKNMKDDLFSNRSWIWEALNDLTSLENQLPFFVLERLYDLAYEPQNPKAFSHFYLKLIGWFRKTLHVASYEQLKSLPLPKGEPKHILDLLRSVTVNSSTRMRNDSEMELVRTRCASELKSAGVKFQKKLLSDSSMTSLFDITFDMEEGVLTIPTINIFDSTENTFRNLIAFEQGQKNITTDYFSAYATFMDGLIDTPRDVELLEKKGIIENQLGNPEDVVTLFNNLGKHLIIKDPYFSGVIEDVEWYHNRPWNKQKASLMQNYFNTPWALISFLAAVFLLIFTVVQTICSILQVVYTPH